MSFQLFGNEVRFEAPWAMALLILVLLGLVLEIRRERRRSGGLLFSSIGLLPRRNASARVRLRWTLMPMRVLGATALIVALAAPQVVHASFDVPAEGIDIVIVLDTSSSMSSTDFGPRVSRIGASKKVINDFVGGLKNDRVGVVLFSAESMVLSPLTLDYGAVQRLLEPVDAGRILRDGTAVGVGLAAGLNVLRGSTAKSRVAVLLTDGQSNAGDVQPLDAAQIAKLLGIRVYTIGAVPRGRVSDVDETLMRKMSEMTGGQYYRASDETALTEVYREIAFLEKARVGSRIFIETEDAQLPFVALGAGLLVLEILLATTVFRRSP